MSVWNARVCCCVAMLLIGTTTLEAHDLDLARVEMDQLDGNRYLFTARISPPPLQIPAAPNMPEGFQLIRSAQSGGEGDTFRYEFSAGSVTPSNSDSIMLPWQVSRVYFVANGLGGVRHEQFLPKSDQGFVIPWQSLGSPTASNTMAGYIQLGIEHILYGIDHLLFVLGLLLLVDSKRRLVTTITAFTVAHCLTLAVVTLGVLRVSNQTVEAAIALSLVFLGVEIIRQRWGEAGITARLPWLAAFGFGLLHGLGFSSALTELGLATEQIPQALLFFNVGIEIGQLMFVAAFLLLRWAFDRLEVCWPVWSRPVLPYTIGLLATFWFVDRVNAMLSIG